MTSPQFLCLNCGFPMLSRSCKMRCPRCNYFEDCSDGTMDHPNIVLAESQEKGETS